MCRIRWGWGALWGLVWFDFVFVFQKKEYKARGSRFPK